MSFWFNAACLPALLLALAVGRSPLAAQTDSAASVRRDTAQARGLNTVTVVGRIDDLIGIARTGSEGRVGAVDLRSRPITREGELLESVPGMIVTQHSGEGKANQYFIRGFNLDHGTDFSTRINGMPVNAPSHGHGQGWTDLNFLIPELVQYVDYKLGVYHSDIGDFGSAGGAEFHLARKLDRPFASLGFGANGLARMTAGRSSKLGSGDLLVGGEAKRYDGPWDIAQAIRKLSAVASYTWNSGTSEFSLLAMAYRNRWNSSDQIPQRAVTGGMLNRFGQIDPTDGGKSQRHSLSGTWRQVTGTAIRNADVFVVYSDLTLFSNFTYFLDDPVRGDQFSQRDNRVTVGGSARHAQEVTAFGTAHHIATGLQTRADFIGPVGLYLTERRARFATVREDKVNQVGTGLFLEGESRWRPWFRSVVGVRGDAYAFDVQSNNPTNSGRRTAAIVSPKMSLVLAPSAETEIYLSGGFGFHSNDARGTTIRVDPATSEPAERVDPLVRSLGAEVGFRLTPLSGFRSTLVMWRIDLDSELLFTGDGGTTEPSAASRRGGVTFANFYRPTPNLGLDADLSYARARFGAVASGNDHIPGALESVFAGGVTWTPSGPGLSGSVRLRHFGSYPLVEDNSVRADATSLVAAEGGYVFASGVRLRASVLNVLNSDGYDIQYQYTSRLNGEPAEGVEGVHYHPVEPRQLRLSLEWKF